MVKGKKKYMGLQKKKKKPAYPFCWSWSNG